MATDPNNPDPLVKSRDARKHWGNISAVTEWRWMQKGIIPRPIKINNRNYYRQSTVNAVGSP